MLECALTGGVNRTIMAIAEQAHVPRTTAYRWLREDESFREAWASLVDESILRHAPAVTSALVSKAAEGDVAGMRLFYDVSGRLKQGTSVTVNTGIRLDAENSPDTEIARRALFAFESWLQTGHEIPESVKVLGAKYYKAKQERAASLGIELCGSASAERSSPRYTKAMLEMEVKRNR